MRDHEVAQKKYDEVISKLTNAKISENLENENKSERFTLLEPPQLPDKPIKPNRIKIAFLGLIMSIFGAAGFAMALESFNKRVRGVEAITALLGHRPLVAIPYITIESELNRRKYLSKYVVMAVIISVLIIFGILHFFVMPLDVLVMKVIARFE
jgi:hypothetical protein